METLSKSPLRSTDRLQQTLAALARLLDQTMNDMQALDSEFQERVLQAAIDAESSYEQQSAEKLKFSIEEAEHNTRVLVTEELETRFTQQISEIESVRDQLVSERVQHNQELEQLRRSATEWEAERARLTSECQQANQLLDHSKDEHHRAMTENEEAAAIALERQMSRVVERLRGESSARWEAERAHLAGQRDRAFQSLADLDAEHQQALAGLQRERSVVSEERDRLRRELEQAMNHFAELEEERNRLLDECEHTRKLLADAGKEHSKLSAEAKHNGNGSTSRSLNVEGLQTEVSRVEDLVHAISRAIEDPATELSVVIRKNAERAELESYLRGLRFTLASR